MGIVNISIGHSSSVDNEISHSVLDLILNPTHSPFLPHSCFKLFTILPLPSPYFCLICYSILTHSLLKTLYLCSLHKPSFTASSCSVSILYTVSLVIIISYSPLYIVAPTHSNTLLATLRIRFAIQIYSLNIALNRSNKNPPMRTSY